MGSVIFCMRIPAFWSNFTKNILIFRIRSHWKSSTGFQLHEQTGHLWQYWKKLWGPIMSKFWGRFFHVFRPSYLYQVLQTLTLYCGTHNWLCVQKMLNHGLNHGFFLLLYKLISCPIHWIACVLAYLYFIFEF